MLTHEGSMRLWLLILIIAIAGTASALPTLDDESLRSPAAGVAVSLDSDHVSFEPRGRSRVNDFGSSLVSRQLINPSNLDANAADDDPPNTNPYKWELCCAIEGYLDCNFELTATCRADFRFKCELDGTLTHRKTSDECSKLCTCFENDSFGPPTISPRDKTKATLVEGASPFEYIDYTPHVPRQEAESEVHEHNASSTALHESVNTDLEVFGASSSAHSADESYDYSDLETRGPSHAWAIVCATLNKQTGRLEANRTWTEYCSQAPRHYTCLGTGQRYRVQVDAYCENSCVCVNMEPTPQCLLKVLQTPVSCKVRWDGSKRRSRPEESVAFLLAPETTKTVSDISDLKVSPAWELKCLKSENNHEDDDAGEYCATAPSLYSCNSQGAMEAGGISLKCNQQCHCARRTGPESQRSTKLTARDELHTGDATRVPSRRLAQAPKGLYAREAPADDIEALPIDPATESIQDVDGESALVQPQVASELFQNDDLDGGRSHSTRAGVLTRRHNYALVCELDGARDTHITRSCAAAPRYYSCDRFGALIKTRYDNYCDQHCAW